ncbi:hypothetical protein [Oceanithermus sp.]
MYRNRRTRAVTKLALRLYGVKFNCPRDGLHLAHPPRRWRWFAGRK